LAVSLVDVADGFPVAFIATTDDLDQAIERATSRGAPVLVEPGPDGAGNRVAVLKGPVGLPVRIIQLAPKAKLAAINDRAPRRAESHLRVTAFVNAVVAVLVAGIFSHLAVAHAPHSQVSFAFLIGFCTLFAAGGAMANYPSGLMGGEDDHSRGTVRTLRGEVAGTDRLDAAARGRTIWSAAARCSLGAAAVSALVLGIASFALLGRPIGFWLLWSWSAALAGSSMVVAGGLARRRGVLIAGRRAHGLPVDGTEPAPLLRRLWLTGALPLAVVSGLINTGLAWTAYRYGVSAKTLGSDLFVSVVVTAAGNYFLGRQWGRADLVAGRVVVPERMRLPARVRLGAQGLVFGMVAEMIVIYLAGHALANPPQLAAAVILRSLAGLIAGGFGFGLGAVAGTLNAAADQMEVAE
ncbi:MAG TPA: hypothetical protein VFH70_03305, partial [Acidimicrobiales bacterium]|nr:hypothetical protein [Acidimicrobiales bacterium]